MDEIDYTFKLLMVGDSQVGKTCLLNHFIDDKFNEDYMPTIGVNYESKLIKVDKYNVKLRVWDTSGNVKFRNIIEQYYKSSKIIFIVYSVDNLESYNNVIEWKRSIDKLMGYNVITVLCANKVDVNGIRFITREMGKRMAGKIDSEYIETSSKTGDNVYELYTKYINKLIYEKYKLDDNLKIVPNTLDITIPDVNKNNSKCY